VIDLLADGVLGVTGGSLPPTALALLWFSAAFSGMIDNIPYTATMIPLIKYLGQYMPILPLWWALSLGACLGGNLTIIGASANVYVGHLAERAGHPISFVEYLKYGALFTFVSIVLAMAYLWVRYLL
jgi:Na+/H+ antiporter NhaD/arsenite permease-like protein